MSSDLADDDSLPTRSSSLNLTPLLITVIVLCAACLCLFATLRILKFRRKRRESPLLPTSMSDGGYKPNLFTAASSENLVVPEIRITFPPADGDVDEKGSATGIHGTRKPNVLVLHVSEGGTAAYVTPLDQHASSTGVPPLYTRTDSMDSVDMATIGGLREKEAGKKSDETDH